MTIGLLGSSISLYLWDVSSAVLSPPVVLFNCVDMRTHICPSHENCPLSSEKDCISAQIWERMFWRSQRSLLENSEIEEVFKRTSGGGKGSPLEMWPRPRRSLWLSSRDLWSGTTLRECLTAPKHNLLSYVLTFFPLVCAYHDHSVFHLIKAIFVLRGAKLQAKTSRYQSHAVRAAVFLCTSSSYYVNWSNYLKRWHWFGTNLSSEKQTS